MRSTTRPSRCRPRHLQHASTGMSTSCTTANGCFRKVNQTGGRSFCTARQQRRLGTPRSRSTSRPPMRFARTATSCYRRGDDELDGQCSSIAENEAVPLGATGRPRTPSKARKWSSETSQDSAYFNHPGVPITASSGDGGYGVEHPAASRAERHRGRRHDAERQRQVAVSESVWSGAGSGRSAFEAKPSWQHRLGLREAHGGPTSRPDAADPNVSRCRCVRQQQIRGWVQVRWDEPRLTVDRVGLRVDGHDDERRPRPDAARAYLLLHDVTTGSNGNCSGSYLCTAVGGYDGPTGLGTPNGLGGFTVGAPAPDFTVGASPSTQTVTKGTSASYTVTVGSLNGFSSSVGLTQIGLANGTFTPPSVTGLRGRRRCRSIQPRSTPARIPSRSPGARPEWTTHTPSRQRSSFSLHRRVTSRSPSHRRLRRSAAPRQRPTPSRSVL